MSLKHSKSGSMLAETVIVMPLLMLLIFGIIQFALIWTAKQMTAYAAFCAARAILVVPPGEQQNAARNAAMVALSWIASDRESESGGRISIPGWGAVLGSGSMENRFPRIVDGNVNPRIIHNGSDVPAAAVEIKFRYPLLIPGRGVNNIIANATATSASRRVFKAEDRDFYKNLNEADGESPLLISGWPYIELTERCVLPMPYSTANFPTGGLPSNPYEGGS